MSINNRFQKFLLAKKVKTLICCVMLVITSPVSYAAFTYAPYVGVEAGVRYMPFKKNFGNNLVQNTYPTANIFVGLRVNDYLGLELGVATTSTRTRSTLLLGRDTYFGNILDPLNPLLFYNFTTKTQLQGFNASILGFYPICEDGLLDLFAALGFSYQRLKIKNIMKEAESTPLNPPDEIAFSKNKPILAVRLGAQSLFCDSLGVRASVGFENTKQFHNLTPKGSPNSLLRASLRNSLEARVGVFYQFMPY